MDKVYADTVRLLLQVAPDVFHNEVFAMKGGTAINLFVRDMPRLSVDIDVVYMPWQTPREQALTAIAAYFSDRGRPFQSDRGRCFSVIVEAPGRHASPGLNVAQSSTISLKRSAVRPASGRVLGFD